MDNRTQSKNVSMVDDEIDILEILKVLIDGKLIIASLSILFLFIGILISFILADIYETEVLLVPNEYNNQTNNNQSFNNFATLTGLAVSPQIYESNSIKAIKKLNTLSFFENNILPKIFLPDLMALDYWDTESNTLIYKDNIFDISNNKWTRDYSYPQKLVPSAQESYQKFKENHLIVAEDKMTGFVTIKVRHKSPFIAKDWAELLISEINSFYRLKDKNEAEKAASYLYSQMQNTNLSDIKQVIAVLLQQETQKLTLIEANEFYVYEYIDPPAVMEEISSPNRILISLIALLFGVFLGSSLVLIKHFRNKN